MIRDERRAERIKMNGSKADFGGRQRREKNGGREMDWQGKEMGEGMSMRESGGKECQ